MIVQMDHLLAFRTLIKVLEIVGMWKVDRSRKAYFVLSICFHVIFIELFVMLQVAFLFTIENFNEFTSVLAILPTCVAIIIKSKKISRSSHLIEEMFEMIQHILAINPMTSKFKTRLEKVEKAFKIFFLIGMVTCAFVIFGPLTTHELPYRMWCPFTYEGNMIMFWTATVYQQFASFYLTSIDVVFYTFPLIFMIYIYEIFHQLTKSVETLKRRKTLSADGSINKSVQIDCAKEFVKIIECHQKILQVTKKFESFFSFGLLISGLQSTLVICSASFLLTEVK